MRAANRFKVQVIPFTNGMIAFCGPTTPAPTICVHLSRMNRVLNIDEDNLCATLEAFADYGQLHAEAMKVGLWNGGSPLATTLCKMSSQTAFAGIWQTDLKYGTLTRNIISTKVVLPTRELLVTGSEAVSGVDDFWEYGPGPDLAHLPFFANAAYGIATKMMWQLFPIPWGSQSIWAYYNDFKTPLIAVREFMRREIGKGVSIIDLWTHSAYFSETIDESRILAKMAPKIFLGLSIEGTERTVAYQTKIASQIITESGGRIAPPELVECYRGHEVNSTGWQQSSSPRILKHLGRTLAAGTYLAVNVYEEFSDRMEKILLHDLEGEIDGYWNHPEPGFGEYAGGPQTYLCQFGHTNGAVEYIFAWDHRHHKNTQNMVRIATEIKKVPDAMGAGPLVLGRDGSLPKIMGTNYDVARKLKSILDPENIMSPGIAFLQ